MTELAMMSCLGLTPCPAKRQKTKDKRQKDKRQKTKRQKKEETKEKIQKARQLSLL